MEFRLLVDFNTLAVLAPISFKQLIYPPNFSRSPPNFPRSVPPDAYLCIFSSLPLVNIILMKRCWIRVISPEAEPTRNTIHTVI